MVNYSYKMRKRLIKESKMRKYIITQNKKVLASDLSHEQGHKIMDRVKYLLDNLSLENLSATNNSLDDLFPGHVTNPLDAFRLKEVK